MFHFILKFHTSSAVEFSMFIRLNSQLWAGIFHFLESKFLS